MLSDTERRNLALTKAWERNWNDDVERMVDESYTADCVVINMYSGYEIHGREALREIEHAIAQFDGTRHMKITDMVASGDVVAIQADLIFGDYKGKAAAFLTFNQEGQILSDNTYGEDPSGASIPAPPDLETADLETAGSALQTRLESKAMPSETEHRNLERSGYWARGWTEDADRMVDECYAPDCVVTNMLTGQVSQGRDALRRAEHAMRSASGPRRMQITRMVASGDKVAVQMDIFRHDHRSKTCAFLTFDEDGLIISDSWYGEGSAGR